MNLGFGDTGARTHQCPAPNQAMFKGISLTQQSTGARPPKNRVEWGQRKLDKLSHLAQMYSQMGRTGCQSDPLTPLMGP